MARCINLACSAPDAPAVWTRDSSGLSVRCEACGQTLPRAAGPKEIGSDFWRGTVDLVREISPGALFFGLVLHADGRREWYAGGAGPWPLALRSLAAMVERYPAWLSEQKTVDAQFWSCLCELFQEESPGCVVAGLVLRPLTGEWYLSARGPWVDELGNAASEYERAYPGDCALDERTERASSAFEQN